MIFFFLDDNVTVFFGISFDDPVDKAIAKLILIVFFLKSQYFFSNKIEFFRNLKKLEDKLKMHLL